MMLPRGGQAPAGPVLPNGLRYRAFLSYRTADRRLAQWLHKRLETYRVPRELVGTVGEYGVVSRRVGPIFRDRDDARTSDDIETIIAHELSKSQHLIVLCTPRAAEPMSWVAREIQLFRERRPDGVVHAAIGEGEPPGCFPSPLLRTSPEGRLEMPLAADLRSRRRGGQEGRRKAVVKIIAGLIGVPFDHLWRREQRRRQARNLLIATAFAAMMVTVAGSYWLLDASRFVREESGTLVAYRGRPGLNLPGYPRREWALDQQPSGLTIPPGTDPTRSIVAVGPRGNVHAALRALTRPDFLAAQYAAAGEDALARATALRVVNNPHAPFEQQLNAWLVFAEVAGAGDEERFRPLLSNERSELRLAAARVLFRLNPTSALAGLEAMRPDDFRDLQTDLLRLLRGPCSPEHRRFLQNAFRSQSNLPSNDQIIDAAIRSGCTLSDSALVVGAIRPGDDGNPSIATFANWTGVGTQLSIRLLTLLENPRMDDWRRWTVIATLLQIGHGECTPGIRRGRLSQVEVARLVSMAAFALFCPDASFDLAWDPRSRSFHAVLHSKGNDPQIMVVAATPSDSEFLTRQLFRLPSATSPRLIPAWRTLLEQAEDDGIRAAVIDILIASGDTIPLPSGLGDSNNLEIRRAMVEHRRHRDERGAVEDLLARVGGQDGFYETELGRIPLQPDEIRRLEAMLSGGPERRSQAACVLAMQSSSSDVLALLRSADAEVRERAADCAPFNREARTIAARMPRRVSGFPLERYSTLQRQVAEKTSLERELSRMPRGVRLWRLQIADSTPGGWGLWGVGMRAWLREQQFLLLAEQRRYEH